MVLRAALVKFPQEPWVTIVEVASCQIFLRYELIQIRTGCSAEALGGLMYLSSSRWTRHSSRCEGCW